MTIGNANQSHSGSGVDDLICETDGHEPCTNQSDTDRTALDLPGLQ